MTFVSKLPESTDKFNTRGMLLKSEPMWRHTTFLTGGPADFYAVPQDADDLRALLKMAGDSEILILGGGSNLLVSDRGIRGLVIDMRMLCDYQHDGDLLILGSGLNISDAAWKAGSRGLGGLEFLFGMPGTVGGAVWMNARCYGSEMAGHLQWADVMDRSGRVSRIPVNRSKWAYKKSPFQNSGQIILKAAFKIRPDDPKRLREEMNFRRNDREDKGHYRAPCAGSAFKNNRAFGDPSGVLIDRCGLKGFRIGGAAVSPWHGNIIINDRGADSADIRTLIDEVRNRVEQQTGFRMEPEIQLAGEWL